VQLHEDGILTTNADDSIYRLVPYSTHEAYFSFEGGDLWLLIQASAPVHTVGDRRYSSLGIASLKIGEAASIRTAQVSNQIYQTACFGAFLLLFMYQLSIYLLRRNDLSNLMIALAALAFLMRCLSEEQVLALYFEQSNALAIYNSTIQFLRFIFLNSASFLVSYFLLKEVFTRAYFNTLTVMNVITILIIVLVQLNPAVPGYWKDRALALLTVTILASALISAWLYFKAWKQAIPGAVFGLLGYTIGPILVGIDSLIIQGRIDFFRVGTLGLLFMTLASSLMTGQQAAEAYRQAGLLNEKLTGKNREIQDMNRNLEMKVHDRTRELKTIFDNIPQGVASLNGEGIISPNYSRHLESILRETNLGGRSIVDFFQRTTLSPDALNRMVETFRASVGENSLSFLLNEGNLPLEVTDRSQAEPLFLALTWGAELAENDEVRSILMTIEDVTVKKRLEVESEKQRKDLLIIQELLQCEPEKFEIFARASEALLAENRRLIQAGALSNDDVKIMFINAHTVKGGARTLGLSGLANILHEIEHEYALIMKNLATAQQSSLTLSVLRAWTVFDLYLAINRDKLGRKTNGDQITLDIEFIRNHYKVLESLMLDNPTTPRLLLDSIRQTRDQLASLIFKSDTHILEQCFEPAAKIAKDLGKPAPEIRLETAELQVPREVEHILRNALIHILRNAMDHG
ncbi:MAG: Hpt domain-containing protein, partial [Pseudobdellovibrionaceae bacterium]|nr:Hpt domain-containing protein [Pseudobdellovibrionaceae bacterium]